MSYYRFDYRVLGPMEGLVEKTETVEFEAPSEQEAIKKAKDILAEAERTHQVSDRFVRGTLLKEVERW